MRVRLVVILLAAATAGVGLSAHDFWLSAAPWTVADGRVTVSANVGEHFPKGTNFTAPERVEQWKVIGATGDVAVAKDFRREGDSLATNVALPAPGAYLGVMTIGARSIEMKADEFTKYLAEEGLDSVIALRKAAGESAKAVKEKYARYAKVAIRSGAGSATHLTRPAGLAAEFIPSSDPTAVHPGTSLTLQLVAGGKPVAGAAVTAVGTGQKSTVKGTTDRDGRVTFKFDQAGAWLVKTVHMVRLPAGSPDGDWESYWVTLAFHTAAH